MEFILDFLCNTKILFKYGNQNAVNPKNFFTRYFLSLAIFFKKNHWGNSHSVARRFFLEITTFLPKNHENHEQKSSKSRKNHGVFNLNSLKIDPPDLFYCIFMHQYFSKIKNWKYFLLFMKEKYNFSKDNLLKKIRPNFWGKIKIKWTIFQLKNAELSKHFWKISKITKYFQNPLKSRSFRWFVTYHGAQIFVTRVMLKITEFVINHEFWQHCVVLFFEKLLILQVIDHRIDFPELCFSNLSGLKRVDGQTWNIVQLCLQK